MILPKQKLFTMRFASLSDCEELNGFLEKKIIPTHPGFEILLRECFGLDSWLHTHQNPSPKFDVIVIAICVYHGIYIIILYFCIYVISIVFTSHPFATENPAALPSLPVEHRCFSGGWNKHTSHSISYHV